MSPHRDNTRAVDDEPKFADHDWSPLPTAVFDEHPEHGKRFLGHDPNEGCEHRTVGGHRAWCLDCGEWCYPSIPCVRCERAVRPVSSLLSKESPKP